MIHLNCPFLRELKYLLTKVYASIIEAFRIDVKCKKLRPKQKLHQFYTINGIARVKLEGNSPPKSITHMLDLVNLFPDIEIDSV